MNAIVDIPRTHDSICGKLTTDSMVDEIRIEPATNTHHVNIFELFIPRFLRTDSWYDNPQAVEKSTLSRMKIMMPSIKSR